MCAPDIVVMDLHLDLLDLAEQVPLDAQEMLLAVNCNMSFLPTEVADHKDRRVVMWRSCHLLVYLSICVERATVHQLGGGLNERLLVK